METNPLMAQAERGSGYLGQRVTATTAGNPVGTVLQKHMWAGCGSPWLTNVQTACDTEGEGEPSEGWSAVMVSPCLSSCSLRAPAVSSVGGASFCFHRGGGSLFGLMKHPAP